jgi:hypothetical protein
MGVDGCMNIDDVSYQSFDVDVDGNDTYYVYPGASSDGNVRMRGLWLRLSYSGNWDDDRSIEFKNRGTSDVLFKLFVSKGVVASGQTSFYIEIPGSGIRFDNGIEFAVTTSKCGFVGVFYS